uniref:Glutathione hydrolase 3 (Trinotate prediction) n=1 Tax=Henneguya salminicola TaxID=69463 RepID=A0A6G3MGM9_HENSL
MNIHSSGIGGGGVMIVHNPNNNKNNSKRSENFESVVYDYREVVPKRLMDILNETDPQLLAMGGLSIAVPGEIAGLYLAWKENGKLPWKRLVEPSIKLARDGIIMHQRLWEAANFMKSFISSDEGCR